METDFPHLLRGYGADLPTVDLTRQTVPTGSQAGKNLLQCFYGVKEQLLIIKDGVFCRLDRENEGDRDGENFAEEMVYEYSDDCGERHYIFYCGSVRGQ